MSKGWSHDNRIDMMFLMHFPGAEPTDENENEVIRCEKCVDFAMGVCGGKGLRGADVFIKCFGQKLGLKIKVDKKPRSKYF